MRMVPKIIKLFALSILLVGCVPSQEPPPPSQVVSKDPFSIRAQGEDGILMELSGNSRGHFSGAESAFDLRFVNQGQSTWMGEFCLQLVDLSGVVTTFEQSEFSLEPGEALSNPIHLVMPEDLAEGAYGLGLVVTERWANITTIYLGEGTDGAVGPWAEPVCP